MRAKICQSCIGRSKAGHDQVEAEMENARGRILEGIDILTRSDIARNAFHFMNLAIAMAARRRNAGATGDPSNCGLVKAGNRAARITITERDQRLDFANDPAAIW
jgi:hypothetical protein